MRSIACVLSAALLVACAGTPPERQLYLLRAAVPDVSGRVDAPVRVGLDRVTVAPYLDQAGIVVETAAGRVRPASEHRWAEPVDAGLRILLRGEISRSLGYDVSADAADRQAWDYAVDVRVDQMHGTMLGTALLEAAYGITPRAGSGDTIRYRFSRSATLAQAGYAGLVDAERRLARELAEAIAQSLRELGES
jgi:uncharacterized lipoprotein YmbA